MNNRPCAYCFSTQTLLEPLDVVSGEHSLFCHTCGLTVIVIPEQSTESVDKFDAE